MLVNASDLGSKFFSCIFAKANKSASMVTKQRKGKRRLPKKAANDAIWLTVGQVAHRWGCHPMTVRRLYYDKKLRACLISAGTLRFSINDVVAVEQEGFTK